MDITKLLELGGAVILPLIILSVIALTLIVELIIVNVKSHGNLKSLNNNEAILPSYDPVSKAFSAKGDTDDKVNTLTFEIQKVERRTSVLSAIASISPLVGLLGTVFGMIKIFNVVSVERPANPLEALSGGISEALFATAGGLLVAIISGFAHHFLTNSLESINDKSLLYLDKN
ncbi:MAG: MotA/TolQ/ExbB proton channel family protein [Candidatus Sericytochromatia bacterium]